MNKERIVEEMLSCLLTVQRMRTLVHMIPNSVTAALCADGISAIGGRPLMAQAAEEMEEITGSACGLAVNLGQPSNEKYKACERALETAEGKGIPAVLDPVGAGASGYRRDAAARLFSIPWSGALKGNSSEIHTVLTGSLTHTGVDSVGEFSHEAEEEILLSQMERQNRRMVIAETGSVDKILWRDENSRKEKCLLLRHRVERPVILVGSGCLTGAVMGAMLAAAWKKKKRPLKETEMALSAAAAVSIISFCGEYKYTGGMGEACREGYGTYKTTLLDALSRFQKEAYRAYLMENLEMQRM